MAAPSTSSTSSAASASCTRLKREDFRRTKHDSAFSQWKILIGAYDWEDHSKAKEGAERYRTQNLPNWASCPGVYELGVATSRETRKLNQSSVVPVYLGQADNLRTRLQQYGRDGAHLENGCSSKELGLFSDVFSRGLPIVYRCALMENKKEAEITEKQLLDTFDYAWNKGGNGERRQDDIRRQLDHVAKSSQFSLLAKKVLFVNKKKVGIEINTREPYSWKNGSNSSDLSTNKIFSRMFGVKKLQPPQVQYDFSDYSTDICGVSIGHGSVCTIPPVGGRKRCDMHKGLRVNGFGRILDQHSGDFQDKKLSNSRETNHRYTCDEQPTNEKFAPTCGFILDDGYPCERKPTQGNKRCLEHKGKRISQSQPRFARDEIEQIHARETHHRYEQPTHEMFGPTCGFILDNGCPCKRMPVQGKKRCFQHKGRRISKF